VQKAEVVSSGRTDKDYLRKTQLSPSVTQQTVNVEDTESSAFLSRTSFPCLQHLNLLLRTETASICFPSLINPLIQYIDCNYTLRPGAVALKLLLRMIVATSSESAVSLVCAQTTTLHFVVTTSGRSLRSTDLLYRRVLICSLY
jgi:hypothetical protein